MKMRRVNTNLSEDELQAVTAAADVEGRSVANWLRRAAQNALSDSGRMVKVQPGRAFVDGQEAAVKPLADQKPKKCTHPITRRIGSGCGECGADLGGKS